jgi:hypothetical protein
MPYRTILLIQVAISSPGMRLALQALFLMFAE